MKKLSSLAGVCAGLLFASVCVGLVTAGPSVAQGGRPPSDVNVVNTPDVKVVNTPNVNVASLPAVQIGNGAANAVPVEVTNLPGEQAASEPMTFNANFLIEAPYSGNQVDIYTVPAGKRLVIEFLSVDFHDTIQRDHGVEIQVFETNRTPRFSFAMDGKFREAGGSSHPFRDMVSKQVQIFAAPGSRVTLLASRSSLGDAASSVVYAITGHLESVP
jgi:hypothetical protein